MSMAWVAVGTAVLGAGASIYGSQQQKKAIQNAANQNAQSQADQNAAQWASYLMQRGVNPAGAATGQIPANPQAINAKLPLWATAYFTKPGSTGSGATRWRKKGTGVGTLAAMPAVNAATTYPIDSASGDKSKEVSGSQKVKNILDPLNLTIGDNRNNFFDPLGLF